MVVAREDTQAKMDQLAAATLRHTPSQRYTVADRLEEKARAHPARPFILYEGTTLDYATVNARANRVAHALRARGITTERVAALLMENRPEFIVTWLGSREARRHGRPHQYPAPRRGAPARARDHRRPGRIRRQRAAAGARGHPAGRAARRRRPTSSRILRARQPRRLPARPSSRSTTSRPRCRRAISTSPSAPTSAAATTSSTSSPPARPGFRRRRASRTCAISASATACRRSRGTAPTT